MSPTVSPWSNYSEIIATKGGSIIAWLHASNRDSSKLLVQDTQSLRPSSALSPSTPCSPCLSVVSHSLGIFKEPFMVFPFNAILFEVFSCVIFYQEAPWRKLCCPPVIAPASRFQWSYSLWTLTSWPLSSGDVCWGSSSVRQPLSLWCWYLPCGSYVKKR